MLAEIMTRFDRGPLPEHERHHTPADHRPGGAPLQLTPGPDAWVALVALHPPRERLDAAASAIETMIETFSREHSIGGAAVLRHHDGHHVVALVRIGGHEAYRQLTAASDDFKLHLEGRGAAEHHRMGLWRIVRAVGAFVLDPAASEAYVLGPAVTGTPSVTLESDDQTQTTTLALDRQNSAERMRIVKTIASS